MQGYPFIRCKGGEQANEMLAHSIAIIVAARCNLLLCVRAKHIHALLRFISHYSQPYPPVYGP